MYHPRLHLPLPEPLFNSIEIIPGPPKKKVILDDDERMNPPVAWAAMTRYKIALSGFPPLSNPKEREEFRKKAGRILHAAVTPYSSHEVNVTIDWNAPTPIAKVEGDFSLDMLYTLATQNVVEPNAKTAAAIYKASLSEYRGPLMYGGKEYERNIPLDEIQRKNIDPNFDTALGDFGAVPPDRQYDQAVKSLKEGLARRKIKGREAFARAADFIAKSTLKGLLPSPYATEQMLLSSGNGEDEEEARKRIHRERLLQVVQDALGYDAELVWSRKDKNPKSDIPQFTVGGHARRLRRELEKKTARENTPKWWTGSEREWKEHRIESDRLGMEGFFAMMDENQSNGGADAITDGIARGMVDKRKFGRIGDTSADGDISDLGALKKRLKDKHTTAIQPAAPTLEQQGLSWQDMTFFGVTHELRNAQYSELPDVVYTSRNPLIDPPRPMPECLRKFIKKARPHELSAGRQ